MPHLVGGAVGVTLSRDGMEKGIHRTGLKRLRHLIKYSD